MAEQPATSLTLTTTSTTHPNYHQPAATVRPLPTPTTTNLQPLYDVFAAYATPPILPADAPAAAVAAGREQEPRTAGMLHLSPQAWRALLEDTQLMLRSGEAMHAPG